MIHTFLAVKVIVVPNPVKKVLATKAFNDEKASPPVDFFCSAIIVFPDWNIYIEITPVKLSLTQIRNVSTTTEYKGVINFRQLITKNCPAAVFPHYKK